MNLEGLIPSAAALDESREQLYFIRSVLKETVHSCAKESLECAELCLDVAIASGPMVDVYSAHHAYSDNMRRCKEAAQAASLINNGLLKLEETADPDADGANEDYKNDTMDFVVANALMEGAMNRMNLAQRAFPEDKRPGSRCDGSIFTVQNNADNGG